jgi:lipopolysaccharide export system protein LptA
MILAFVFALFLLTYENARALESNEVHTTDEPIHIESNEMWYNLAQDRAFAKGNAWATQGDKKLYADLLTVIFKKDDLSQDKEEASKINSLIAEGGVRMISPTGEITGSRATYDLNQELLTILGNHISLQSDRGSLEAHQSLTYDHKRNTATANGDVRLIREDQTLKAQEVICFFKESTDMNSGKNSVLKRAVATRDVIIESPKYTSKSDAAIYNAEKGHIDLIGNVFITDGQNIFEGPCGQYDEHAQISRLIPCDQLEKSGEAIPAPQATQKRAHALIYPQSQKKHKNAS